MIFLTFEIVAYFGLLHRNQFSTEQKNLNKILLKFQKKNFFWEIFIYLFDYFHQFIFIRLKV